jgi:hypothetical protein
MGGSTAAGTDTPDPRAAVHLGEESSRTDTTRQVRYTAAEFAAPPHTSPESNAPRRCGDPGAPPARREGVGLPREDAQWCGHCAPQSVGGSWSPSEMEQSASPAGGHRAIRAPGCCRPHLGSSLMGTPGSQCRSRLTTWRVRWLRVLWRIPSCALTCGVVASTPRNGNAQRCFVQGTFTTTASTMKAAVLDYSPTDRDWRGRYHDSGLACGSCCPSGVPRSHRSRYLRRLPLDQRSR